MKCLACLAMLVCVAFSSSTRADDLQSKLGQFEAAIAERLHDPAGARFRGLHVVQTVQGDQALCGEVRWRNTHGVYGGYEQFYALMLPVSRSYLPILWTEETRNLMSILEMCHVAAHPSSDLRRSRV